jgi:phosphatidylglycerophosphatase A
MELNFMREKIILFLASAGYSGYLPYAPGTAGTLVGFFLYLPFSLFPPLFYALSTGAVFLLALWVSKRAEIIWQERDSPKIVIDEVVGYLIAMAFLPRTLTTIMGGFLFFRALDIMKPYPIGKIDRNMKGGLAVVLDDAVAGVFTNLLMRAIHHWHPAFFYWLDKRI